MLKRMIIPLSSKAKEQDNLQRSRNKIFLAICILFALLFSLQSREIVFAATNEYTVVFKANGGSGSMSNQKIVYNESTALKECKFKRTGYQFKGWAKSKDGAVEYKDKEKVKKLAKAGKKINLYAVWKAEPTRRAIILGETSTSAVPILDVNSMVAMMKQCTFSGQQMDTIVKYNDHTKSEIKKKIKSVFSTTKTGDISYIYMTCHGDEDGSINIGSDDTSFKPKELRNFLAENIKGKIVLMVDCCYAGMTIRRLTGTEQSMSDDFGEKFISEFVDKAGVEKGSKDAIERFRIICSSAPKESSMGGRISLATKYWELGAGWNAVKKTATSLFADKNGNGKVALKELYNYSYENVLRDSIKDEDYDEEQHVQVYPENSSFVIFGRY